MSSLIEAILKVAITSALVVAISELAKRSTLFGALLASLPLTSVLAFVWIWYDTGDTEKVASLATSIFWLVLPSLVLFLILPALLRTGFPFWPSLATACFATAVAYFAMLKLLALFEIST